MMSKKSVPREARPNEQKSPVTEQASGSIPALIFGCTIHTNLFLLYGIITLNMSCEKTEDFR